MDLSPAEFLADVELAATDRMTDPLWTPTSKSDASVTGELEHLQASVDDASGSPDRLRIIFADLVERIGRGRASHLWLRVFGAQDAAETG